MEKRKWYEKYLPFVARSPEMQLRWLESAFRKGVLAPHEITPYIKLFMAPDGEANVARVRGLLHLLSGGLIEKMLEAADIYDVPDLFRCIAEPTVVQAVIAITKTIPPYEKTPQVVIDKMIVEWNNPLPFEKVTNIKIEGTNNSYLPNGQPSGTILEVVDESIGGNSHAVFNEIGFNSNLQGRTFTITAVMGDQTTAVVTFVAD